MRPIKNIFFLSKSNYNFFFQLNTYFFLLIVNFITYSIYAVLSKYNIFVIEILINLNFLIFFYLYKKNPDDKISFNFTLYRFEIIFFLALFLFLIILSIDELNVPLFGDEIAPTRRATRTALFSSFLFVNIFDINYLKEVSFKHIIHLLSFFQILFIIFVVYLLKKKKIIFLIFLLLINFVLRYIIKDAVHHPPLNHIFSTTLISFFGLNHAIVRISYLIPFWFFLVFLFKLISTNIDKKISMLLIVSIATFPFLIIASVVPDHSIWSSLIFTYLLFYIFIKKNINYKFCIALISVGILFRISIFSGFILIFLVFIGDIIDKKFIFIEKIKSLLLKEKVFIFTLIFIPLFMVSIFGTPAFKGIDNTNPFILFFEALKSNIIFQSLIKQIPLWYLPFIISIFFTKRRFEIIIFFILNLVIYFSIKQDLWGNAKYVLEYGLPFFILGYFIFAKMLIDKKKIITVSVISLLIIFLNINDIYKFPNSRISADLIVSKGYEKTFKSSSKETKYFLKIPYSYDDAFTYIKEIKAKKTTLLLGTTYGFYPEILENYNYNDLIAIIDLRRDFDNIGNSSYSLSRKISELNKKKNLLGIISNYFKLMQKSQIVKSKQTNLESANLSNKASKASKDKFLNINKVNNLEYILLADYGDIKKVTKNIISQNWSIENKFYEPNYRSTLILFKRN